MCGAGNVRRVSASVQREFRAMAVIVTVRGVSSMVS